MRNRSVRGAIAIILVVWSIYWTAAVLENIISDNLKDFLTRLNLQIILENDRVIWMASLALVVIMTIGLVIVQNAQTDTPLRRGKGRLAVFLEIATGLLSMSSALLSNDVFNIEQLNAV